MSTKKWVLFFLLSPLYYLLYAVILFALIPLILLFELLGYVYPEFRIDYNDNSVFFLIFAFPTPFATYIYAKFFGIFKYVDRFEIHFLLKCCFISFITVALTFVYSMFIAFCMFIVDGYASFDISFFFARPLLFMPFSFLMYKFFQFLTKKYPVPFEKIGYYSSIEFWRKTFSSFLGKFKVKSGK